jgi:spore germination protein GerM
MNGITLKVRKVNFFQRYFMKRLVNNQHAIKLSRLLTTVIALSISGSLVLATDRQKPSDLVTNSSTTPTNLPPKSTDRQSQSQVYWLRSKRNKLALIAKSLPHTTNSSSPQHALTAAMQKLLAGAPTEDLSSKIPKGTKLRSLQVYSRSARAVQTNDVYIDLSKEFRWGGGSTSVIYRVAQVIYTASSLDPNSKVFVSVEGQPIDRDYPLGGEGLILSQPTTRTQFAKDFALNL